MKFKIGDNVKNNSGTWLVLGPSPIIQHYFKGKLLIKEKTNNMVGDIRTLDERLFILAANKSNHHPHTKIFQ